MRNDTKQILEDKALKEEFLIALQYVVDSLNNGTTKEEIFDNLEDLKEYGLKLETMKIDYSKGFLTNEEREYIRHNTTEENETVSNCCGATLMDFESDICSDCLEHCDVETI